MNLWKPIPAVRLFIPFVAGIVAGQFFNPPLEYARATAVLAVLPLAVSFFLLHKTRAYGLRWVFGFFMVTGMFLWGLCFDASEKESAIPRKHSGNLVGRELLMTGVITEQVIINPYGLKTVLNVHAYKDSVSVVPCRFRILAYFRDAGQLNQLGQGQRLIIRGVPERIPDRSNPGSFNYARFMEKKGVMWQVSLRSGDWIVIDTEAGSLKKYAITLRNRLLALLKHSGLESREFAVTAALLFGYTSDIDQELKNGYSVAGATHILSVSGMHVGVVYLFLELLLGFLNRKRWGVWLKCCLLIFTIWFYALLTGMSPPVMRAAAMLSLIIAGKTFRRHPEPLNIIATSAFILLVYQPSLIQDIGFQFSYMAVAGLLFFYKPIYDCYVTSRHIPDKIWSVMAASIAAQLTTFPIALYYFHQFPNYFLLTNILVVPLSALIIYVGMITLAFSPVPVAGLLAGKVLSFLVCTLNGFVLFVEKMPWSLTNGVFINVLELVILFMLMVAGYQWLVLKRNRWLLVILALLILVPANWIYRDYLSGKSGFITVYNFRGATAVDFIYHSRNHLFLDYKGSRVGSGPGSPTFNHWGIRNVQEHTIHYLSPDRNCFRRYNRLIYRPAGPVTYFMFSGQIVILVDKGISAYTGKFGGCDLVILRNNAIWDLKQIKKMFNPSMLVADGSNRGYYVEHWRKQAAMLNLPFHAVQDEGAFVEKIK